MLEFEGALWLHVLGKPVPYVRMTQRGKFVRPEAKRYLASKDALALQMRSQMGSHTPLGREPLVVHLEFWYASGPDHRRDLDNEIKAVLDAGNGIVWEDDRWIDVIVASRHTAEVQDGVEIVAWRKD
jgi:crossover junction endodeoxyribonuclease RusA